MLVGLALILPLPAFAGDIVPVRTVTASGTAERSVAPDEARVNVTASASSPKLETAKAEHDRKLKDILAIAKQAGIEEGQIKTNRANIQPQHSYENHKQVFKAYQVQTSLELTVKKIDGLGDLLEKLSAAKLESSAANDWSGLVNVSYTLSSPEKLRDELLADAIRNARFKAERMAEAAGAKLGRASQINEGNSGPVFPPMPMRAMAMKAESADMAAAAAPMAPPPGEQKVNANVTVTFELRD